MWKCRMQPASPGTEPQIADDDDTPIQRASRRDNFPRPVKVLLAQRVGYLCSNPECQAPTIGPKMGEPGAQNVGVAAHIKAASPGFARYDDKQTPEARSSFENGIWLCQTHSKLIDHDANTFTVAMLHQWKQQAERLAFRQLMEGRGPAKVYSPAPELVEDLADLRRRLMLPEEIGLEAVQEMVSVGALAQIEAFEGSARWPRHAVKLELVSLEDHDAEPFEAARLPSVLRAVQTMAMVAPPGAGKSTTTVQIARAMLAQGPVPVLIPLGEWGDSGLSLFDWLARRRGYEAISPSHFSFLAYHGELAVLLDGYNEVPTETRLRLIRELEGHRRDYPLLNVFMTGRSEARSMPVLGQRVSVLPLTDEQQIEIAGALRGSEGLRLRDHAWRTKGLGDLISIPLYLRALMETHGNDLPDTKEEVIQGFVTTHESDHANAEIYYSRLQGEHRSYLVELASAAQEAGSPTLSESDAIKAVGTTSRRLVAEGILSAAQNAKEVLDVLVAAHSLVREGDRIAFQHQQIQEWFASMRVDEDLMAAHDLSIGHPLVVRCLNDASWSEVVLFACERMSRRDQAGARTVAEVVRVLLSIDPRFAAQIVARSADAVWEVVGQSFVAFGTAWLKVSKDRAVGFMIESQRPEFADVVWPLATHENDQTQMRTMRLVQRFNPRVLGDHPDREFTGLAERRRAIFAGELASHGDRAGMELAHRLAAADPSSRVREEVFNDLSFRRATYLLEDLLRVSGDSLMEAVADRGYFDGVENDELRQDLERRRRDLIDRDTSPEGRVAKALKSTDVENLVAVVRAAIPDPLFSVRDRGAQLTYDASLRVPLAVAEGLAARAIAGLELPYRPFDLLDQVPPSDAESIERRILDGGVINRHEQPILYLAGPRIVNELLLRYLAARRDYKLAGGRRVASYDATEKLGNALEGTRAAVFFEVLRGGEHHLSHADIAALSHVISAHGRNTGRESLVLNGGDREKSIALINGWAKRLLDEGADRGDLASLTWAMRRMPDPTLVPFVAEMLRYELYERRKLRASYEADKRNEAALNAWRNGHEHEYRTLLTIIGTNEANGVLASFLDDPDFGPEAAVGMQVIWLEANDPRPSDKFVPRFPDFERVVKSRALGWSVTSEPAALILAEAKRSAALGTPPDMNRAATIAGCAVLLPHGEEREFLFGMLASGLAPRIHLHLAERMVVGGYVLESGMILDAIAALIAERKPEWRWLQDNDGWDLFDWLALLPASDDPAALVEGTRLLFQLDFHRSRVLPEFRGLRMLSEVQRVAVMRGIVGLWPEYVEQHEFYDVLREPGMESLELILDGMTGRIGSGHPDRAIRYDYAETLFHLLDQGNRDRLMDRYLASSDDRERAFLGSMLLVSGDHAVFLKLVGTETGRRLVSKMHYPTRERLLYTKHPDDGASMYELIPRNLDLLRKGLFDLVLSDDSDASKFATRYLDQIDGEREAEGMLESGHRHPNIENARPWPLLD